MEPVAIQSFPSSREEAAAIALSLNIPFYLIGLHSFPDGELRVSTGPAAKTTVLYASLDQPNDKLIALLFAVESLRRNGAVRLVLVAPYLCYMRQDAAFNNNEGVSQKAIGDLLAKNFDRIITVDAHLHRVDSLASVFLGIEADNLSAAPAIAIAMRPLFQGSGTVVVGPDLESWRWANAIAKALDLTVMVAEKVRHGDRTVEVRLSNPKLVAGHPVLLVDDIVSSGRTLISCCRALQLSGASMVDAMVTHALYPDSVARDLVDAGIRRVYSTNSVCHPSNYVSLNETVVNALKSELRLEKATGIS